MFRNWPRGNETVIKGKITIQMDLQISEKVAEDWICNETGVQDKIPI